MNRYRSRLAAYDEQADNGSVLPIYQFGDGVLEGDDLTLGTQTMYVPGFAHPITLPAENPYDDMS